MSDTNVCQGVCGWNVAFEYAALFDDGMRRAVWNARGGGSIVEGETDVRIGSGTLCIAYEWQRTSQNSGEKALGNVPQIKFPNVRKSN